MPSFKFSSLKPSNISPAAGRSFIKTRSKIDNDLLLSSFSEEKDAHYTKMLVNGPIFPPFNPRDFDIFDEKITFKTNLNKQTLYLNVDILSDSLFSARFKFAGIRCENYNLIRRAYCHDIFGTQIPLPVPTVGNANAVKYIEHPSLVVVDFKMIGHQEHFTFSLLIDDLDDRAIEDFYTCDPQVGNDPPQDLDVVPGQ